MREKIKKGGIGLALIVVGFFLCCMVMPEQSENSESKRYVCPQHYGIRLLSWEDNNSYKYQNCITRIVTLENNGSIANMTGVETVYWVNVNVSEGRYMNVYKVANDAIREEVAKIKDVTEIFRSIEKIEKAMEKKLEENGMHGDVEIKAMQEHILGEVVVDSNQTFVFVDDYLNFPVFPVS